VLSGPRGPHPMAANFIGEFAQTYLSS
jgi:hypothetical protein